MKASKILAGLSALSIAASMLSMVAAADDDVAGTAPTGADEGSAYGIAGEDPDPEGGDVTEVEETTGTADDADYKFGGKTYAGFNFGAKGWIGYKGVGTFANKGAFIGWPGWGVSSFPTYWELYEDYLKYRDSAWEVWGTKQDNTIPGYIVFQFDDAKKYVIPITVDKNGQVVTDKIPVFDRENIEKIYFLFEVSDAPQFDIALDKVTVGDAEVKIEKDYLKGKDVLRDASGNPVFDASGNYIEAPFKLKTSGAGNVIDETLDTDVVVDQPMFYQATIYDKYSLNPNDFDNDYKFDDKKALSATNHDETPINHKVFFFGNRVQFTFTVSGIGSTWEAVHQGEQNNGGDQEGKTHTHVEVEMAGDLVVTDQQAKNLDARSINPKFRDTQECSKDLYDALMKVYSEDPDHKTDAEIKFKTVSDKNGILVANFLNVWELDTDKDGNAAHWLKDFVKVYETDANGNKKLVATEPVYVKKQKVHVTKKTETPKQKPVSKPILDHYENPSAEKEEDKQPVWKKEANDPKTNQHENINVKCDGESKLWYFADGDFGKEPVYGVPYAKDVEVKYEDKEEEHWVYDYRADTANGIAKNGHALGENSEDLGVGPYDGETKFLADDKVEEAYCWHPYFVTENGLVDIVTKNYLGNYKTNVPDYNSLTDAQIKYLSDNNGMYYNDNIHSAAYGHFVVFGDNTLREYSYRIKADAVKAMLEAVQRSKVARDDFVARHGADDIEGFNKDWESVDPYYLDYQAAHDNEIQTPDNDSHFEHHRAVHGAIWLQVCDGNRICDVSVHAHTDITKHDDIPKLYGKENYEAMYPKKPADSSSAASAAAAQPTAAAEATDANAESGAAAGFGIAGLLLAGAAMVCAKKKS